MNYKGGFVGTFLPLWLVLSVALLSMWSLVPFAQAAALTSKSDTQSSLKASTLSNHSVLFTTPTGVASGQTITLTWTSFSIAAALDFEDLDLSEDATPDGVCDTGDTEETLVASGPTSSQWSAVRTSATVITFTSGGASATIGAGSEVCVEVGTIAESGVTGVERITNPTNGSYTLAIGGTMTDSGSIAIEILTDDQVAVTATVTESLTFTISDNTIGFGTLSAGSARYATGDTNGTTTADTTAHNLVIGTNATNGYTTTLNGATLTAGVPTITAIGATATTTNPGTEQFGVGYSASGGSGTVTAPYATASQYAFDTAAFPDQVNSATGATANTTYNARYIANIASNTDAGSYTATLTYIATANF